MRSKYLCRLLLVITGLSVFVSAQSSSIFAQARRQPPQSDQKKNKRPGEGQPDKTGEKERQEPLPPDMVNKQQDVEKLSVTTNIVNVDAVVYNKKTGQPMIALKKDNFAIYVDGVKKDISNFSTPEAPITLSLVVEYSKLGEILGYYGSGGMEPEGPLLS